MTVPRHLRSATFSGLQTAPPPVLITRLRPGAMLSPSLEVPNPASPRRLNISGIVMPARRSISASASKKVLQPLSKDLSDRCLPGPPEPCKDDLSHSNPSP